MPYPTDHREQVRRKIVNSARKLFNRSGFESVSVGAIMAGAGLTHGGFYSYFKSKSDLYVEVLACFLTDPKWKSCWEGVSIDLASADASSQIVRAYLSRQHFEDVENSCPMTALPCDVARSGDNVKTAFEGVFKAMVTLLGRGMKAESPKREETAMAIAALCIGGMVVARSLNDGSLSEQLRNAATRVALELGGWMTDEESHPPAKRTRAPRGRRPVS
jgi:TetR/AcrR family transcriptional repressor of nem operon